MCFRKRNDDIPNIKEKLLDIIDSYFCMYAQSPRIHVEVYITNSLRDIHMHLRPDLREKYIDILTDETEQSNGRMVPPLIIGGRFYILLNQSKLLEYTRDGSYTWIGTIAHELTHAIDFFQMASLKNLNTYDDLLNRNKFPMFVYWSEYHARRCGYQFLRATLMRDNSIPLEEQITHILNSELPKQHARFMKDHNATNNGTIQINECMQFLGRLSVWQELFPDAFSEEILNGIWCGSKWLMDLYFLLLECKTIEEAVDRFDEMKQILSQNYIFD